MKNPTSFKRPCLCHTKIRINEVFQVIQAKDWLPEPNIKIVKGVRIFSFYIKQKYIYSKSLELSVNGHPIIIQLILEEANTKPSFSLPWFNYFKLKTLRIDIFITWLSGRKYKKCYLYIYTSRTLTTTNKYNYTSSEHHFQN